MANVLAVTIAGIYTDGIGTQDWPPGVTALQVTVAGNGYSKGEIATSTGGVAVPLAGLTSPFGWAWFKNLDATNTITLLDASSGHTFAKLLPGEAAALRLGSSVTAPTAVASASTPILAFAIFPP